MFVPRIHDEEDNEVVRGTMMDQLRFVLLFDQCYNHRRVSIHS